MTYEQENGYMQSFYDYMHAHNYYGAELDIEHTPIDGALILTSHIVWGDWKHDHLYYGCLLEKWAKENGLTILVADHETEIDEEDGSDTYSAYHRCSLYKSA